MSRPAATPDGVLGQVWSALRRFAEDRVDSNVITWVEGLIAQQDQFGFDPFGFQPEFLKLVLPWGHWVYHRYFRTETFGAEHLPEGRVMIVANHSGQIPIDGLAIVAAGIFEGKPPRLLRSMVERWVPTLPFASYFFARTGQVVGTPENCRRLLANNEGILVFPEGVRGISKTFDRRYQLEPFGLGFMRLALETDTTIVPVAVIGAEEQAPAFANAKRIARLFRMPSFPLTPTFPWLGPLGLLPLPVRYRLHFGEPLHFEGDPDEADKLIGKKVEAVRRAVQTLVDHGLRERTSVFF